VYRAHASAHDGLTSERPRPIVTSGAHVANVDQLHAVESIFTRMRAAAAATSADARRGEGGVHVFSPVVIEGRAWPAEVSHEPGLFAPGLTWVDYCVRVGNPTGSRTEWNVEVQGRFCVVVGDDPTTQVPEAEWRVRTNGACAPCPLHTYRWADQLPSSAFVPNVSGVRLTRAIGRLVYDGEEARADLIRSQRGLVCRVVEQYRRRLALDTAAADGDDLVQVGLQRLLELAMRRYAAPAGRRPTTAAWSKVALREVANAVKAEIASVTGMSVEFRQLLTWFRTHPADRDAPAADVAFRMAHAAGVTRLLQARRAPGRDGAERLLDAMLADGSALYVAPGADPSLKAAASAAGRFVIAPRSSLVEIERAQRHNEQPAPSLDAPMSSADGSPTMGEQWLVDLTHAYGEVEARSFLSTSLSARGVTPTEAAVWLARTGALGGGPDELPEIADDLGLSGRAEARAALRRAWRKLEPLGDELLAAAAC
jgi:hypothetical protein